MRRSGTAWSRSAAPCLTTVWPPARAPAAPKCGWWASTTASSPPTKRRCGLSATEPRLARGHGRVRPAGGGAQRDELVYARLLVGLGAEAGVVAGEQRAESRRVIVGQLSRIQPVGHHGRRVFTAQIDDPAVHAGGQMIAGAAHKHDDAAGHVLAEEVARVPADDDDRALPAVLLHVDAAAPAAAVAHDELAAAHGVAGRIAHAPVHHYGAGVHGVGGLVLGASEHSQNAAPCSRPERCQGLREFPSACPRAGCSPGSAGRRPPRCRRCRLRRAPRVRRHWPLGSASFPIPR